jgi:lysophospholipase L1-like esterase
MSVLSRVRACLLACGVVSLIAVGALVSAPAAGAANIVTGSTYLALGDSLAYGYHAAQFAKEYPSVNPANYEEGYVNDFGAALKLINPKLQIINDGCPGETTETFINGPGAPYTGAYCAGGPTGTPFPYVFLHHPYTGYNSQLEDALAILKETPNVSPITIDIGANDILQFLEHTCGFPATYTCTTPEVETEFAHIAGNVYYILGKLHAAAPQAQIVLVGLYDPYPLVLPAPGGDRTLAAFNSALASVAEKVPGTIFANPEPRFNPSIVTGGPETEDLTSICAYTAMCPGGTYNPTSKEADIHPTTLGYAVMAEGITDLFAPTGATGAAGATGATGPTGAEGKQGASGPTGAEGKEGAQGASGPTGATGLEGKEGGKGVTGATGPEGKTGAPGATGPTGEKGEKGATGVEGREGKAGPTGKEGTAGKEGAAGKEGKEGAKGSTGATGPTGKEGQAGKEGPAGKEGAKGATGASGGTGATGPAGNAAVADFASSVGVPSGECLTEAFGAVGAYGTCPSKTIGWSSSALIAGPMPANGAVVSNLYAESNATLTGSETVVVAVIDITTETTLLSCTVNSTTKSYCSNTGSGPAAAAGANLIVKVSASNTAKEAADNDKDWRVEFRY